MLLLWPGSWELEEAVKKRCEEITSFLETRPVPEARVPSSGQAAAGCSGWGRAVGAQELQLVTDTWERGNPSGKFVEPGKSCFPKKWKVLLAFPWFRPRVWGQRGNVA